MRLTDLRPKWITEAHEDGSAHTSSEPIFTPTHQGVIFLCPKCFATNSGPVGTHSIIVPFSHRRVPEGYMPGMPRWTVSGTDFNDLTTTPSIRIVGGCEWHGFITNGDVSII